MNFLYEDYLRNNADEATLRMVDIWKKISLEKVGYEIDIVVGNRKEHPHLKKSKDEVNTGWPIKHNSGKVYLALWMEKTINPNYILISHEIGHWILKLQGFHAWKRKDQNNNNIQVLLSSLSSHIPLYNLQRSIGQDPQKEINERAAHNVGIYLKDNESRDSISIIESALYITDDILNCSNNLKEKLINACKIKHPNTLKLVNKIQEISEFFDLYNSTENLKFSKSVIKELKLNLGNWETVNNMELLKNMLYNN